MELEGGAGRVRLADFYHAALNKGQWQFSENVEYLRQVGALDESSPENLRIIIPNYVNGPSNCAASSSYYSVCCLNECDELLGHIETQVIAPEASPEQILALVSALQSSTVPGNHTLSPWLTQRLQEVSDHHRGMIPLHGRLFGQWMHYAFPRECPFPHVFGTIRPQAADDWVRETRREVTANMTEMERLISKAAADQQRATEVGELQDLPCMWTMQEELMVPRAEAPGHHGTLLMWSSRAVSVAAIMSGLIALKRSVDTKLAAALQGDDKYFV